MKTFIIEVHESSNYHPWWGQNLGDLLFLSSLMNAKYGNDLKELKITKYHMLKVILTYMFRRLRNKLMFYMYNGVLLHKLFPTTLQGRVKKNNN